MTENIQSPNRRGTGCYKWDLYKEDILPLWVADMDFTSPPAVMEALHKRVDHGVFGYPTDSAELADLVAARMKTLYGWEVRPEDMLFLPGVVPGFNLVCQAVTEPGESMVIQTPVYPPFLQAPKYAQVRGIRSPLVVQADGSFSVDYAALENAIEGDTKCLLFCNPHNPVGKVFKRDELEKIAEICLRHDMVICSDEIHSDLVFSGNQHIPIAALSAEVAHQTVTLIAPSKTFNVAGLECSVLICTNHELKNKINHSRRGLLGSVNIMGITAGIAAYQDGAEWLTEILQKLEANRDFLCEFVEKRLPKIKINKPEATYLAWLDCRGLELGMNPYQFFLENAKVALNKGDDFGEEGSGFVRLNFGCPKEILEEALVRMENALKGK